MRRYAVQVTDDGLLPQGADHRIIFHGINKSGSSAVATVIRDAYFHDGRAHECFSLYSGVPRYHKDAVAIINHAERGQAFFLGHQLYGAFDPAPGQLVLTQIRHPLPRMVSVYNWLKRKHADGVVSMPQYPVDEPFPTLDDFIVRGNGRAHTQMVQLAVGFGADSVRLRRKLPAREIYERATEALAEHVAWFGIAEYLEESLYTYAAICGLPSVTPWARDERNVGRPMIWDVAEETRALIEEVYEYEVRFYTFARDRFLDGLKHLELGGDFDAYKEACAPEYKDRLL